MTIDSADTKTASQDAVNKVLELEVNSNFVLEICWKHDNTSLQLLGIHNSSAFYSIPFYHVLFLRYLVLVELHFSSDILVPFQDSNNLYIWPCGEGK